MTDKKKLVIPLLNGETWETEAEIVGDLGVHPSHADRKKLSVTHVPTLLSITAAVPSQLRSNKKKLIEWCGRVQEAMKKDWLAMRKFKNEDVRQNPEHTSKLRERIRTHCLTVKE